MLLILVVWSGVRPTTTPRPADGAMRPNSCAGWQLRCVPDVHRQHGNGRLVQPGVRAGGVALHAPAASGDELAVLDQVSRTDLYPGQRRLRRSVRLRLLVRHLLLPAAQPGPLQAL